MNRRILVPTDGSEGSRSAIEHAIDLAVEADTAPHAPYIVQTNVGPAAGAVEAHDVFRQAGEQRRRDAASGVSMDDGREEGVSDHERDGPGREALVVRPIGDDLPGKSARRSRLLGISVPMATAPPSPPAIHSSPSGSIVCSASDDGRRRFAQIRIYT